MTPSTKKRRRRKPRKTHARKRQPIGGSSDVAFRVKLPRVEINPSLTWLAVHAAWRCERKAAEFARLEVGHAYVPEMAIRVRRNGRWVVRNRLPAPGWLFVGAQKGMDAFKMIWGAGERDEEKTRQRSILGIYGPIRPAELEAFSDHLTGNDGSIDAGGSRPGWLAIGKSVIVTHGPFTGLPASIAALIGHARIRAEVNLFGRGTMAELDIGQVRAP